MGQILVGLAGPAGVGKDTAAKYLAETFLLDHYAFANPIKEALGAMGFERRNYDNDVMKDAVIPEIGVSYRKLAQTLGTEWGRAIHPEFWLRIAQMRWNIARRYSTYTGMVISDVRFANEADWVRKSGLLIHITGPARREIANDGRTHSSEAELERVQGDVVVTNGGSLTFLFGQLNSAVSNAMYGL